ncbi:hypothetical protein [Streptomyces sp. NPDC004976]
MPVPILCHFCHEGRYTPRGPGLYAYRSCGTQATAAAFPVQSDERLVVLAGVLQVLAVPDGHQVITPTRRCHAPHLGAGPALALRLSRTQPVYRRPEDIATARKPAGRPGRRRTRPLDALPRAAGRPHPGHGRPQHTTTLNRPAAPRLRRHNPGRPHPQPAPTPD